MAAGRVSAGVSGSMTRSGASEIEEVYFGFDIDRLFLRIDLVGHRMLSEAEGLEVLFTEPRTVRIVVPRAPRGEKAPVSLRFEDGSERSGVGAAAADACVEICVPFADLGASAGETMRFRVERTDGGDVVESLPESSTIPVTVPTDDFEKGLWQV